MRNVVVLLLFSASLARGGFERSDAGARARALAGAYTALGSDVWSMFHNPAGLARLGAPEAGFFISPRPFGLGELSYAAAAAALPTALGVVGVAGSRYGFDLYREEIFGVSVALTSSVADLGIMLSYYAASVEHYGSSSVIGLHAGCIIAPADGFRVGFRIRNLNAPVIGRSHEKIRQSVAMGGTFRPNELFTLSADVQKEISHDLSLRAGAEYALASSVILRLGVTDHPSQLHAGVGFRQGIVQFDYALTHSEELGQTHECSLSLRWGGDDEK